MQVERERGRERPGSTGEKRWPKNGGKERQRKPYILVNHHSNSAPLAFVDAIIERIISPCGEERERENLKTLNMEKGNGGRNLGARQSDMILSIG